MSHSRRSFADVAGRKAGKGEREEKEPVEEEGEGEVNGHVKEDCPKTTWGWVSDMVKELSPIQLLP